MRNHPSTRSYRRQLARQHKCEHYVAEDYVRTYDPYEPKAINKPYCPNCHKEKLQFETKESAEKYIELNGDKIFQMKGKRPVRAYYCKDCCCWHVTSKPYKSYRNTLTA